MLTLQEIRKDYGTDADTVHALRGVTLHFRPHEFVAILGPSGCGKTTLLNIIGGLDHYTDGDLVIGGVSTKEYRDRDWDAYRNHRVGFIFQSYNLIPHQSVLANVELALTLSGVSKAERRERAREALARVGLADQVKKKPNQMSGGQMQRVAIARALVNDPEIILADEPTGALDTATSEQIMSLLGEISDRKLIVMVTHNPDIAERYATRIIRVLDGQVVSDSNPYDGVSEEAAAEAPRTQAPTEGEASAAPTAPAAGEVGKGRTKRGGKRREKTSMSFFTALSLSLNNLMTKKARTFLTSFAGSIGIIGIALILALSNGINIFIDKVQEDTLSSYPVEITTATMDLTAMLSAFSGSGGSTVEPEEGYVYSNDQLTGFTNALLEGYKENDLAALRAYIESDESHFREHATVQYRYSVTPQVYYKTEKDGYLGVNPSSVMSSLLTYLGGSEENLAMNMNVWDEMIDNRELLESQYTMLAGRWPTAYNEVVLVTDKNRQISDLYLYALGLKDPTELRKMLAGEKIENTEQARWAYEDLIGMSYKLVLAADYYRYDERTQTWTDLRDGSQNAFENLINTVGTDVKIVGVVGADPDATATSINGAIGYTSALSTYIIEKATEKDASGAYRYPIVGAQIENPTVDAITGKPFYVKDEGTDEERAAKLDAWLVAATDAEVALQYEENLDAIILMQMFTEKLALAMHTMTPAACVSEITRILGEEPTVFARLQQTLATQYGMTLTSADQLLAVLATEEGAAMSYSCYALVATYSGGVYDARLQAARDEIATQDEATRAAAYRDYVTTLAGNAELKAALWDTYLRSTSSMSTERANRRLLGITSLDDPSAIYLYPRSFEDKDAISEEIRAYNEKNPNREITYTDYIGLMLSSVSVILNVITYVLVAFVSISLVVSSIMIGIITYISVLERIKEIGILRAIGASKRDVSHVFLAETLIVGFIAGMIGILATLLLSIPVNIIIRALSGFNSIGASLPFVGAVILVLISMALTLIAGVIPARLAAKKEPVEALRSE